MVTSDNSIVIMKGDVIGLEVFDINQHGQGVARTDGMIVFVDDALPGEAIQAEIRSVKKNYAIGEIASCINPSVHRVKPRCPLAGRCGGCAVQHMAYRAQLEWKHDYVANMIDRAHLPNWETNRLLPIIGMENPWYYRAKVQIPFAGKSNVNLAGFYARRSHDVVDGDKCYIQHPIADVVRAMVRNYLQEHNLSAYNEKTHKGFIRHVVVRIGFFSKEVMVIVVTNDEKLPDLEELTTKLRLEIGKWTSDVDDEKKDHVDQSDDNNNFSLSSLWINVNNKRSNVVMEGKLRLLYGQEYINETILGIKYRISPKAFFQVNPLQTISLYKEVLRMADLKKTDTVLDLYCGTGSITLLLAANASFVRGVEIVEEAISDAWQNAEINDVKNVEFYVAAAEEWLFEYIAGGGNADAAVIDPPRKGCDIGLINALLESNISKLIYVSCNPATLVRDLVNLSSCYRVISVRPVDMFPHSDSIECVCRLERI